MDILLSDIKEGMPGITPIEGADLQENCVTMLHRQGHQSPITVALTGLKEDNFLLHWDDVCTEQMLRTYADHQANTERSAIAVSVLLAKELTGYSVILRSRKGTGFDYYLGEEGDSLYTPKARLEISGIEKETVTNTVTGRFKQKLEQVTPSDITSLPAYISIVEFSTPKTHFESKD